MNDIRNTNPYALYVHCDGAMNYDSKNTGGIGIEIDFPESVDLEPIKLSVGKFIGANIERLELEAIIRGMKEVLKIFGLHKQEKFNTITTIIITTDRFSLNDDDKTSPFRIAAWRKDKWHNHEGKAIKNSNLLDDIDKLRKKLYNSTHCRINIVYQRRKYHRNVDKLAKEGKSKIAINDSISVKGIKIGPRKFDAEEVQYALLKEKENYLVRIFKKESVLDQWEICAEFCEGKFIGKKLKIYTDIVLEKRIHRQHIYSVRLKNVFQHHIIIYKTFKEIKNLREKIN